jgi:hypothetical protein
MTRTEEHTRGEGLLVRQKIRRVTRAIYLTSVGEER